MSESEKADRAAAERRQQAIGVESGAARAAVLGINDGLVTNTALILGVVGATDAVGVVQLTGLASLVAGACSMAAGEYVSMRAQVELLERLLEDERRALIAAPDRERAVIRGSSRSTGSIPPCRAGDPRPDPKRRPRVNVYPARPEAEPGRARTPGGRALLGRSPS